MNISIRLFGAAAAVAFCSTSAVAQSSDETQMKPKVLFVQHADEVSLSDGTLTLTGVNNNLIAFTDRPFRVASVVPMAKLIEIWNKGNDDFAEDPPNAAVVGEVDGKATSLIVEITNPQMADGNLTFNYVILEGQDAVTLEKSYVVIDETWWGDLDSVMGVADDATGQNGDPLLTIGNIKQ